MRELQSCDRLRHLVTSAIRVSHVSRCDESRHLLFALIQNNEVRRLGYFWVLTETAPAADSDPPAVITLPLVLAALIFLRLWTHVPSVEL